MYALIIDNLSQNLIGSLENEPFSKSFFTAYQRVASMTPLKNILP